MEASKMTMIEKCHHVSPDAPLIRDVIDFHLRWPEFRNEALDAAKVLSDPKREIISWLIALADRVGEADVAGTKK
jgi:hypothetical protein